MTFRRMMPFIILNVFVSAVVVLAVLYWWDSRQEPEIAESPPVLLATSPISTKAPTIVAEVEVETQEQIEEDGPLTYTVQRGDTLGSISNQFEIPMLDIMEANGIDNPNFLQVNQALIIPILGLGDPVEEATSTSDISILPSPIPTILPLEGEAVIDLLELTNPGDLDEETVSIVNNGDRPVALSGWKIIDEDGHAYTFGQVTLFGEGAAITIHSKPGEDRPTDLFWGNQEAVWQVGETITLIDSEGTVRTTLIVGS